MNENLPVADVEETATSIEDIAKVRAYAEAAVIYSNDIAKLELLLANKQAGYKQTVEHDLPNAMIAARLETWPLPGGARFDLATIINASIPKDQTDEAFELLEKQGHGDLIKRRIQILFGREDIAWAKKFLADCARRKRPLDLSQKAWIEPQTFSAFVREQIKQAAAEGRDPEETVPTKLFGVFKATYAKFVASKVKK
jgi:hypothetical protein